MPVTDYLAGSIDALNANIAILDGVGLITTVNDKWRRFGSRRNAASDYIGLNYLDVCTRAAGSGDSSAARVAAGLRRLLSGEAQTFGHAYVCAERTFRMSAHRLENPLGGLIVAHEDITSLLVARQERDKSRRSLREMALAQVTRSSDIQEALGQRLTAISLAAQAIERGGDVTNATTLIHLAVNEARRELRTMNHGAAPADG